MMTEQAARDKASAIIIEWRETRPRCDATADVQLESRITQLLLATDREARDEVRVLRQALERIVDGVPASEPGGGLFIEHRDENGEYIGSEQVDPIAVISCIVGIAASALAARGEVEG